METEIRQGRDTIENKDTELNDLQTQFKSVSQQLYRERQYTERKNHEILNAERAIEELTQEQTRLTVVRQRENLDAQRLIDEKEREVQEIITICEGLEAELIQEKKVIDELQKILNDKDMEITELHAAQRDHSHTPHSPTLEEEEFHSQTQLENTQLKIMENEIRERKQALESKEKQLEIVQNELHRLRKRNLEVDNIEAKLREEMDRELRTLTGIRDREVLNAQRNFKEKEMALQQKVSTLEAELLEKEESMNLKANEVSYAHKEQNRAQKRTDTGTGAVPLARGTLKMNKKSSAQPKRCHTEGAEALTSEAYGK